MESRFANIRHQSVTKLKPIEWKTFPDVCCLWYILYIASAQFSQASGLIPATRDRMYSQTLFRLRQNFVEIYSFLYGAEHVMTLASSSCTHVIYWRYLGNKERYEALPDFWYTFIFGEKKETTIALRREKLYTFLCSYTLLCFPYFYCEAAY